MIKSITVYPDNGTGTIKFTLKTPELSGFNVREITGIDPAKAVLNMTAIPMIDGSIYNSSHVNHRNIVMRILIGDSPSVEHNRHRLYRAMTPGMRVRLEFETTIRTVETYGYIESFDVPIFTQQEEAQVSILCPNAHFQSCGAEGTISTVFYGIEPKFEFIFSNESLHVPMLEFGSIENRKVNNILYDGDARAGVVIKAHAMGTVKNITVNNHRTRQRMSVNVLMGAGDDIIIDTNKGNKSILLRRNDGNEINIINQLGVYADWFYLESGDNPFSFTAEQGTEFLMFKIEHCRLYAGV